MSSRLIYGLITLVGIFGFVVQEPIFHRVLSIMFALVGIVGLFTLRKGGT